MKLEDFIEKFNWSPLDSDELAEAALQVKGELGESARVFLNAQREFDKLLEDLGFERG